MRTPSRLFDPGRDGPVANGLVPKSILPSGLEGKTLAEGWARKGKRRQRRKKSQISNSKPNKIPKSQTPNCDRHSASFPPVLDWDFIGIWDFGIWDLQNYSMNLPFELCLWKNPDAHKLHQALLRARTCSTARSMGQPQPEGIFHQTVSSPCKRSPRLYFDSEI